MKKLIAIFFSVIFAATVLAQPTNLPTPDRYALTVNTNLALIGIGTNFFWTNLSLARIAGFVVPTNPPVDGYVPMWTGNQSKWAAQSSTNSGTNVADTSNLVATNDSRVVNLDNGMNQFSASVIKWKKTSGTDTMVATNLSLINGTGDPDVAFVGEIGTALKIFWSANGGIYAPWYRGNAWALTNFNWMNITGIAPAAKIGLYSDQDQGSRVPYNYPDGIRWLIPGSSNTFLQLDGSNIISGTLPTARLGTNPPAANTYPKCTDGTNISWVPGLSLTNLGGNIADSLTAGRLDYRRLSTTNTAATSPTNGQVPTLVVEGGATNLVYATPATGSSGTSQFANRTTNHWAGPSNVLTLNVETNAAHFYDYAETGSNHFKITGFAIASSTEPCWAQLLIRNLSTNTLTFFITNGCDTDDWAREYIINAGYKGLFTVGGVSGFTTNAWFRQMH